MDTEIYKIGDYVEYVGDYTTLDQVRRTPDIAKILVIRKFENIWIVTVELMKSKQKISFDVSFIRPILLQEKHLLELGFVKFPNSGKGEYFLKNGLYISSIVISIPVAHLFYLSGFTLVNDRIFEGFNIDEFINSDDIENVFKAKEFREQYPSIDNVNKLFRLLKEKEVVSDETIEQLLQKFFL